MRCATPVICSAVLLATISIHPGFIATATAEIALTSGALEVSGSSGSLALAGDSGFTFDGRTYNGVYAPGLCAGSPCYAGQRISLLASWSGSDLVGIATLLGVTYPRVGDNFDTSSTASSLLVEFWGSALLPAGSTTTSISAPFVLRATFFKQGGAETLAGSGVATLDLSPIPGYPEERWAVSHATYRLGARPPSPWASQDIGTVGLPGRESIVGDTVVVAGDGSDIWGTSDAFHFLYQPRAGTSAITARLAMQRKTYRVTSSSNATAHVFAKAGLMIRDSIEPSAASVVLDVKPGGGLEFMVRYAAGEPTTFVAGAPTSADDVWLRLAQGTGGEITGSYSSDGSSWTALGTVTLSTSSSEALLGLAVTSHDDAVLNGALFDEVSLDGGTVTANLLEAGGFEEYLPPMLGPPGWISDDTLRQVPAKSETHQPRSGAKNGACWTTGYLDCGLYQEVIAPVTGAYSLRMYASADRTGGLVGANVNGATAASAVVEPRPFGSYEGHAMQFTAVAGDTIRVWMYSPATPGYVVVDDVSLVAVVAERQVTSGNWTISPISGPFGAIDIGGASFTVRGTYDQGAVEPLRVCGFSGSSCHPGDQVALSSEFLNETPVTFESYARGSIASPEGVWEFVELGGAISLRGGLVTLPGDAVTEPQLLAVSAPFTASGTLKGFEVLGLRDPRLVFEAALTGRGTATLEVLVTPLASGGVVVTVYRLRYVFEA